MSKNTTCENFSNTSDKNQQCNTTMIDLNESQIVDTIYNSLRRVKISDLLNNNEQHFTIPIQSERYHEEEFSTPVPSDDVKSENSQQQATGDGFLNWTETEEQRLIVYYKFALKITSMSIHQNSEREIQTDVLIWEAVTKLFNEPPTLPRSKEALVRKFGTMKTRFDNLYNEFKDAGRNGAAPNALCKNYALLWDCLKGNTHIIPSVTSSSGLQTLKVNNNNDSDDVKSEVKGPVTEIKMEDLINSRPELVRGAIRRNYEAMMENDDVEHTRHMRRRTNYAEDRQDQVIEAFWKMNEDNMRQRDRYFEEFTSRADRLERQGENALKEMRRSNQIISSIESEIERSRIRLDSFLETLGNRNKN